MRKLSYPNCFYSEHVRLLYFAEDVIHICEQTEDDPLTTLRLKKGGLEVNIIKVKILTKILYRFIDRRDTYRTWMNTCTWA